MIYFPSRQPPSLRDSGLRGAEDVSFRTDDGLTLNAWWVPPAGPGLGQAGARLGSGTTVVVFSGNAGHRGMRAPLAAALADHGIAVLLTDYRGYGGNPGSPSEDGLYRDARAARAYVAARRDVDASRIVYFGESLGTAVAARLATEQAPRILVLRSPFTSLLDIGRHHYPFLPVGLLLRDRFETLARIRQVTCPSLVIAGDRDGIIPLSSTKAVYEAAPEPKRLVVIRNADHNDWELLAGTRMIDAIVEFLRRAA